MRMRNEILTKPLRKLLLSAHLVPISQAIDPLICTTTRFEHRPTTVAATLTVPQIHSFNHSGVFSISISSLSRFICSWDIRLHSLRRFNPWCEGFRLHYWLCGVAHLQTTPQSCCLVPKYLNNLPCFANMQWPGPQFGSGDIQRNKDQRSLG